jgi:hypothetical protein
MNIGSGWTPGRAFCYREAGYLVPFGDKFFHPSLAFEADVGAQGLCPRLPASPSVPD